MSLIAFTNTGSEIQCFSDGHIVDTETKDAVGTNFRKVWKVNDRVALFWVGWFPYDDIATDIRGALTASSPRQVATQSKRFIEDTLTPSQMDVMTGVNRQRICLLVVGYEGQEGVTYKLDSEQDFKMETYGNSNGNSSFMGYDKQCSDPETYLSYLRRYSPHVAFTKTVRHFEELGKPVGGQIFSVSLNQPAPSRFMSAINK